MSAVAPNRPDDGRRYGFFSSDLLFGSVAAALRYNVFSRIVAELFTRLFGMPLLRFFDYFGALLPDSLARVALSTFTSFCGMVEL